MQITIKFIPHDQQRYATVGDWLHNPIDGDITILVSNMTDLRSMYAVAVHELLEVAACHVNGVSQQAVDDWDINGGGMLSDDPGALPDCPYHREHMAAEEAERAFCRVTDLIWDKHEENINGQG